MRFPVVCACLIAGSASAAIPDARFSESTIVSSGISQATGLARPPDGSNRIFIITKGGAVRILRDGALLPAAFATITPIYTGSECGLVGIAFDPDYATNGYVYFFVTVSSSEQQIIRYTDVGDRGEDKTVIVPGLPTIGANHDGGGIGFGPDGNLYWAVGDNGSGRGVDNDLASLASKVGRAKPDGAVPADNPFVDGAGGNNDFIWARGFRNPFTLTFEPGRGRLWVNTVGTSYEQVFVVNGGDHAGWNNHENNQPANYLAPVIKYRTNGSDSSTIPAGGAVRSGGVLTITTNQVHGFRRGERITLSGIGEPSMNGAVYVASVPSTTSFTAAQAGSDLTNGGGSASTQELGGCITGGTFYDGNDFPAEFSGNFLFGDYNSDRLMRAVLDGNGDVAAVDTFGTSFASIIDLETGPDGALWILQHGGSLIRAANNHASQAVIVSATHLRLVEGGRQGFSVRLATEPAADVTVDVRNSAGDPDVTVERGATLTFTPANWDRPQPVLLFGALDFDTTDDVSMIAVESPGLSAAMLEVTVRDNNTQSIVLATTMLEVREGLSAEVGVSLSDAPEAPVTVTVTSTSPDLLIAAGAQLTFTSQNYSTPQSVIVAAVEDQDAVNEVAHLVLSSAMVAPRRVEITIRDNDTTPPSFTSTPPPTAVDGARYMYDADASGLPAPTFVLETAPPGAIFDRNTGELSFIPRATGLFQVVIRATNGVPPDAEQRFEVDVRADQPPSAMIVKPEEGATLSGANADWYGNGTDDVAVVRAEFSIDGNVVETQTSTLGRYNFGGGAGRFDTTQLADGSYTLKLTVYDAKGQSGSAERRVTIRNQAPAADAGVELPGGSGGESGCGCAASPRPNGSALWIALMALMTGRVGRRLLRRRSAH